MLLLFSFNLVVSVNNPLIVCGLPYSRILLKIGVSCQCKMMVSPWLGHVSIYGRLVKTTQQSWASGN